MTVHPWPILKGLSAAADHMTCPEGFLMQMDDFMMEYGRLRPRFGANNLSSGLIVSQAHNIDGGIFYVDKAQSTNNGVIIVQTQNQKYFRSQALPTDTSWLNGTLTWTDITGAANTPGVGYFTADILNNILVTASFQTGASTNQITSDSSNAAALAGSPPNNVFFVKVVNNFCFLSGFWPSNGTITSRVYWSNVGDPQTWSAANFIDYRTNDGDIITGLGSIGQDLLIFKSNHIARLSTQTVTVSGAVTLGPLSTLFDGVGAATHRAIDNLPDGRCVFLGSDWNLYVTDGISLQQLSKGPFGSPNVYNNGFSFGISQDVQPSLYPADQPSLISHPSRNEIWCSVANTFNVNSSKIYVYDWLQNYWRRITNYQISSFFRIPAMRGPHRITENGGAFRPPIRIISCGTGTSNSNILVQDDELITNTNNDAGGQISPKFLFSVTDPEILGKMVSIDIPASATGTEQVTFGFDGNINAAISATLSTTTTQNRIPIPWKSSYANVRPSSLQVQVQAINGNTADLIYSPYFSDQVLT